MFRLILMFIFLWLTREHGHAFEVRFQESYPSHRLASDLDADSQRLHKRDMQQFFDKATYNFDGLVGVGSVPVPFPLDICMLQLPTIKYATALHKDAAGVRHFAVFAWHETEQNYVPLLQQPAPKAVALDCLAYAGLGYVALSYNHTEPVQQAREGSPVYELAPDRTIRTVQYFAGLRLRAMYLRISSQELTLLQVSNGVDKKQLSCPYFKWTGGTFQRLGGIPCTNARRLEAFGIDYADYVAVANYASADGRTSTHSEIYKYDATERRFELFQRLRTNGAVDVKYFSLPVNEVSRRHFLLLGNTVGSSSSSSSSSSSGSHGEADTVIYVYENGQFVPYQRLSFYALERFLPVTHVISEKFLLFVACNKQDVKIYNLNDWKFEESKVQFTEGAFSRGVARMRSYEENEQSYLVIANENMAANETNIFQPLFKQDEHANVLRQQIIDWAREQMRRLEKLNLDHLVQALQQKLKERERNLQQMHIKNVITNSLVDIKHNLTANYWDALRYATRALDVIQHDVAVARRKPVKRAAERQMKQHEFERITVETLVVHDKVQAKRINGVDQQNPVFESVNAEKVYVSEEYREAKGVEQLMPVMEQLTVQDLQLAGKLNGLSWTQLLEQTLKRRNKEIQFIKANVDITNLKADAVLVNSKEINEKPVGQLISIDSGNYIVQQDVQFAQPIEVNQLVINQRLNHIHVDRQRLDVLLRQANHTQVIEGVKRLENINVLEPITIAGQMLGADLRAMSPMKVTHDALHLLGDYVINADVTIGQLLQLEDLQFAATQRTALDILEHALRVDQPLENVNLRFEQPLSANNTQLSFINAQDMQQLVQLNVSEVQVIDGTKWLPQSLTITDGFGEVNILNNVNLEQLSQRLLLKSSNQTIQFPVQLAGLELPHLNATKLQLNDKDLHDYMRHSGEQRCNSSLYVDHLQVEEINVEQLHLHGTLFGKALRDIYQLNAQQLQSWQLPANFRGTIQARNLWLKGHMNNVSVVQLEQQLQQLAGNIKYVGDFSFPYAVNISGLSFGTTLNGIDAQRFGRCWLETDGEQIFTAPQTLAALTSDLDIQLKGRLNNYTLEQLVRGSYRLNASEQLDAVKFANPIVLKNSLNVGRINGLRVPQDMLYAHSDGQLKAVKINGKLVASSQVCNVSYLNRFQLRALASYLNSNDVTELDTLHVERAQFTAAPDYASLNGHQLHQLLDELWLDNELVELNGVQIVSARFEGLLEFEGMLNGLNVERIGRNYFSRTRRQQLNVALNFEHDVTFAKPLAVQQVQLRVQDGSLVEGIGNVSLNFDDFVANTLKTAGAHTITGQWNIPKAHIPSDLNNVLVNQLNLVDDVLRNGTNEITLINAPKTVESAVIKRLYATPTSTVANVPVVQWINDAVYIYGNHTIEGTTTLETLNLLNDLRVEGPVNGVHWASDQLLLCDHNQQIAGSLLVENALKQQHRLLSMSIEELWVDKINGQNVNELLTNRADNRPNLHVASQLIFTQPLTVANYELGDVVATSGGKIKRDVREKDGEDWQQLSQQVAAVHKRLTEPSYVLENFVLQQQLPLNASHLQLETRNVEGRILDILSIWHSTREGVAQAEAYVWQPVEHNFQHNPSVSKLLPPQPKSAAQHLANYKSRFDQIATDARLLCPLRLNALDCLALQKESRELDIYCYPSDNGNGTLRRQGVIPTGHVKQLLASEYENGTLLILLGENSAEFWHVWNGGYKLRQRLQVMQAEQMAVVQHDSCSYLAILTTAPAASLRIYRSCKWYDLDYQPEQVFDLEDTAQPRQLRFIKLHKSQDLLLCVSNAAATQPLRIYQHQGVAGFQQILGDSTLPVTQLMEALQLPGTLIQFMALTNADGVFLLMPQYTRL